MPIVNTHAESFLPGEYIRDELDARGWTQADLAEVMGRPLRSINEIIAGKKAITPETAVGLSQAFGTSAEVWLNLETAYRLSLVVRSNREVAQKARIYGYAPVKDMIRRGWIEESTSIDVLEKQIAKFFEVPSLDQVPQLTFAARKSTTYKAASPGQMAWVYRAMQLARKIQAKEFSRADLPRHLSKLRNLALDAEELRHIPQVLAEAGIRFLVIEHLPGSKIDGATFCINNEQPVIALSLRFDRIDWLWQTLGHEIGHIENNDIGSLDTDLSPEADDNDKPENEKRADEFGAQLTIATDDLDDFIVRTKPLFSKNKIQGFAARIGVHPGIVVGQLQHRKEILWSHSREMLVKIRSIITSTALTDGWGSRVSV